MTGLEGSNNCTLLPARVKPGNISCLITAVHAALLIASACSPLILGSFMHQWCKYDIKGGTHYPPVLSGLTQKGYFDQADEKMQTRKCWQFKLAFISWCSVNKLVERNYLFPLSSPTQPRKLSVSIPLEAAPMALSVKAGQ